MTQIEFQNMLKNFFDISDNKLTLKTANIESSFIELNSSNEKPKFTGFSFKRGEHIAPLNIVWEEATKTVNFTYGSELAHLNFRNPKITIIEIMEEGQSYEVVNESVVLCYNNNGTVFLPKKYEQVLTVKVIGNGTIKMVHSNGSNVAIHSKGTHRYILNGDRWIDIT